MENNHQSKSFPLNGFNLTLSLEDSKLSIKAEHSSTLSKHSVTLNDETAKRLTNEICEDVGTLYQLLLDSLEKEASQGALSINNEALLSYQANIQLAKALIKVKFTIQLEKEDEHADPLSRVENKYQNPPGNEEIKSDVEQKDQNMKSNESHSSFIQS